MSAELERTNVGLAAARRQQGIMSQNCHVCRAGYEITGSVNRMLLNGAPFSEVYATLISWPVETFPKNRVPSITSIKNHANRHLPVKDAAVRKLLEKRAAERQMDIENGAESILTGIGILEIIAQKGFSAIIEGKNQVSVKETIEAVKLIDSFDKEATDTFDSVAAMAQVHRILAAVQKIVPAQYMDAIYKELENNEAAVIEEDDWLNEEE
jgi:hypothetical protein